MANISRIKLDETTYEIKDAQAARASDLASKQDALTAGDGIAIDNSDIIRTTGIPFGTVDGTSTSTAYTATVPGIYKLEDGVCCMLKNGVVTSAAGFTVNVNGLGAKPVYNSMAAATADTTIFNINYTMLFVYDSTRVSNGCWICYRGYNSDADSLAYRIRHNSSTLPTTAKFYRYRILFTSADGTHYVPSNTSTSTNATAKRDVNQTPINPFGEILYYATTTVINAEANPAAAQLWSQNVCVFGYSFNRTGAALVLLYPKPVYLKCAPQSNGSAIIDATTPYVQALPAASDDKIYIFLGIAYDETHIELLELHPIYYHDGTGIRIWTGKNIPTKTSELTNDSNFVSNTSLATVATSGSYDDLTNKPTIPDISNLAQKAFIVEITAIEDYNGGNFTYSCNKTNAEIYAAWQAGRLVIAIYRDEWVLELSATPTQTFVAFSQVNWDYGEEQDKYEFIIIYIFTESNVLTITNGSIECLSPFHPASSITATNITTWNGKLDALVSGTNIKTINNQSLLGSGNLTASDIGALPASTNIPTAATSTPLMDGTAAVGSSSKYANEDHVHPSDTSKANVADLATVATSGSYNDLTDKPNIPAGVTVDSTITQNGINPVLGGAIYDVLQDKEDAYITVIELIWDEDVSSPIYFKDSNNNTLTHSQVKALFDDPAKNIALWLDSLNNIFKLTEYHGNYNSSSNYYLFYTPPQSGRWELGLDYGGSSFHVDTFGQLFPSPNQIGAVPSSRKVNNKPLSSDITLTANDVGAATSSDISTAISNLVNSAPTTLDTLNELATALGNDPNFATTITNKIAALQVHVGSVAGKLYRNNVGGSGNFTVSGNSGCIPNLTAGTFLVSIYAKSATQSYTFRFNFGSSVTYDLSTTNGEISDVRQITIPSSGTFSGLVLNGSVASGTILYVIMYNYLTPVSTVGIAAVTNRYADLDGTPTIPTVNNGTLTIQKNGTTVQTFTANLSSSVTANITVPTTASDVGAVPTTRKINNKELSSDITLNASDVGADVFVVNISATFSGGTATYTSNKTFTEIYNAILAKKHVIAVHDGFTYYTLTYCENDSTIGFYSGGDASSIISIESDNSIHYYDLNYQPALVSGTNIKTINNQSLLGSGNLTASDIGATTRFVVDFTLSGTTISNPNKTFLEIKAAYDAGNLVLARDDAESLYYLLYCETTSCGFFCCDLGTLYDISVDSSNNWTYHETDISQLELDLSDKSQITYMQKVNNVWKKVTYNDVTGAWMVGNTTLVTGNTKNIYLDRDNNDLYYWNGSAFTLLNEDKVLSDWNLTDNTKVDYIKNKPSIPTTASDINAMSTSHAANAITSNDINNWNSKADILTLVTVSGAGSVTYALDANKFYKFGSVTALTLTLNAPTSGLAIYGGKFTASADDIAITLPSGVTIPDNTVSIQSAHEYEFNILDNVYIMMDITTT